RGDAISAHELEQARSAVDSRDPCLLVYTSGSTGAPKGALLHHAGIIDFAKLCNSLWPVTPHRVINYFPINHIGSIVDCMMPCLVAGGTQIMLEQFDPVVCLELIERERVTLWGSVPSVFQMQLALPDFARFDLSSVQLIAWGGAAMPRETIERLRSICPKLATNYGMTETSSAITMVEPTDDLDILANTVGHPRAGAEVRLVDGEIQVRSSANFLGYWQQPDATAAAFTPDGFFRTGDLGEQRADGRIRLIGRLKEMYKSGGYNVYPREVESVIEAHPSVAAAAVVSITDPVWQEIGVAYVVPRESLTTQQLEQHCRERLANYKRPKHFVLAPELPLLPIGKVDKRTLRAWAERLTASQNL
ncbi:MAG TPA: fatty acid--CoA ligase family protein, partial [Steroidobacter sp.]